MERTSNEKQAAAIAQQQKDAIGGKHSQNLHHGGQQQSSKNGATRKSREGRSRSQEWPDVPDIGKIQENNPEILAQKILETGRQIEAGRIPSRQSSNSNSRTRLPQASLSFSASSSISSTQSQTANKDMPNRTQEPPRVANFEDRLKSIITSVLNEDQQNRNKQQQMQLQVQLQSQSESERKRVSLPQNVSTPDYTQVSDHRYLTTRSDAPVIVSVYNINIFYRFYLGFTGKASVAPSSLARTSLIVSLDIVREIDNRA